MTARLIKWACFLCIAINYMDRTVMSIAIIPMGEEFGWNATESGLVLSSFFVGYFFTQIPGGYMARTFGGKKVLAWGCTVWSMFTLLSAFVGSKSSVYPMLLTRFCVGLGEAVAFPVVFHLLGAWIPESERPQAIALVLSASHLGAVLSLLFIPPAVVEFGWRVPLVILASMGLVWVAIFVIVGPDDRKAYREVPEHTEADTSNSIEQADQSGPLTRAIKGIREVKWRMFLCNKAAIAIYAAHFCFNWGW